MPSFPPPAPVPSVPPALHVIRMGTALGLIAFSVGFFGPMLWAPDANQGPLLGIFITGPLGFVVGLGVGIVQVVFDREWATRPFLGIGAPRRGEAGASFSAAGPPAPARPFSFDYLVAHPLVRILLALFSIDLLAEGARGLARDPGRGAASAIVIGVIAAILAAAGRIPSWLKRGKPSR